MNLQDTQEIKPRTKTRPKSKTKDIIEIQKPTKTEKNNRAFNAEGPFIIPRETAQKTKQKLSF